MKKGAIFGIIAAFIIIAMLIFLPVIINNSKAPAETVSTDVTESEGESTAAETTEKTETETDAVTDGTTAEEPSDTVTETETETEEESVSETEEETTEAEATTEADAATAKEETETETEKEPETTKAEETTKEEETTKQEETTSAPLPVTTAEVKPLDPEKKYVAFTFDDGPHKDNSKRITDKLLEYGGKGTFFVVGNLISGKAEEGMKYAYEHGMEIGLHCWSHDWYYTKNPEKYHDEVYKGAQAIYDSIGVWPTLMRPPGGNITEEQYKSSEFAVIIWDVDSNDWRYKYNTERTQRENIDIIVNNIMSEVKPGSIILMHEIYENSYLAFCEVIEKLSAQGYEFVTVSELLQNPETGYKYYSATYKKG